MKEFKQYLQEALLGQKTNVVYNYVGKRDNKWHMLLRMLDHHFGETCREEYLVTDAGVRSNLTKLAIVKAPASYITLPERLMDTPMVVLSPIPCAIRGREVIHLMHLDDLPLYSSRPEDQELIELSLANYLYKEEK